VVVAAVPEAIAMTKELSAATSSVNLLRSFLKDQLDVSCEDATKPNPQCFTQRVAASICCKIDDFEASPRCETDASTYVNYFDDDAMKKWHRLQQTLKSFMLLAVVDDDAVVGEDRVYDLLGNRFCISLNDCCVDGKCDGEIMCSTHSNNGGGGGTVEVERGRGGAGAAQSSELFQIQKLLKLLKREDDKMQRQQNSNGINGGVGDLGVEDLFMDK